MLGRLTCLVQFAAEVTSLQLLKLGQLAGLHLHQAVWHAGACSQVIFYIFQSPRSKCSKHRGRCMRQLETCSASPGICAASDSDHESRKPWTRDELFPRSCHVEPDVTSVAAATNRASLRLRIGSQLVREHSERKPRHAMNSSAVELPHS